MGLKIRIAIKFKHTCMLVVQLSGMTVGQGVPIGIGFQECSTVSGRSLTYNASVLKVLNCSERSECSDCSSKKLDSPQ